MSIHLIDKNVTLKIKILSFLHFCSKLNYKKSGDNNIGFSKLSFETINSLLCWKIPYANLKVYCKINDGVSRVNRHIIASFHKKNHSLPL